MWAWMMGLAAFPLRSSKLWHWMQFWASQLQKLLEDVRFFYPMRPDAMVLRGLSFTVGALQWKSAVRHDTKRKDFQGSSMIWYVFLDDNGQVSWGFSIWVVLKLDTSLFGHFDITLSGGFSFRCRSNRSHGGSKWCWEDLWAASLGTNRTWQAKTKKQLGCWQFSRPELLKYIRITVEYIRWFVIIFFCWLGMKKRSISEISPPILVDAFASDFPPLRSTLVGLMLRFYDPKGGRVMLNQRPLTEYNLRLFRKMLGWNTQFVDGISVGPMIWEFWEAAWDVCCLDKRFPSKSVCRFF